LATGFAVCESSQYKIGKIEPWPFAVQAQVSPGLPLVAFFGSAARSTEA
jgi:hypothetical protein